jgi:hypothetical protein
LKDTALYRVPVWAYNSIASRFLKNPPSEEESEIEEDEVPSSSSETEDFEVLEKVKTTAPNGNGKAVKRKKIKRGR